MNKTTPIVTRTRPAGVTILAALAALLGLILVVETLLGFAGWSITGSRLPGNPLSDRTAVMGLVILLILGVLAVVFALAFWGLRRWAFWATVVVSLLIILLNASAFMRPQPSTTTPTFIVNIVLGVIILIYLFADRRIRAAFRR